VKKKPARPQKPQLTGHGAPPAGGSGAAVAPVRRGRPAPRKPAPRGGPVPGGAVPGHGAPGPLPGGGGYQQPPVARKPAPKKKPVKRKLALGEAVACCAAEALATSLRLTGRRVTDRDVLALYDRTADGPDAGASISETLEAAAEHGLAGFPLVSFRCAKSPYNISAFSTPLILGMDLPGPHAVLDVGGWWWSWGEPYDPAAFPGAVIEEAWEIRWPR